MELHFTAEYSPWANGEDGAVAVSLNGQTVFSIPAKLDAGPKEPQIEAAVCDFIAEVARAHGALKF